MIKSLSDLSKADVLLAGGKGANLGELAQAGFSIPQGFCITTQAYQAFTRAYDLEAEILQLCESAQPENPQSLEEVSSHIRGLFEKYSISPEISGLISRAYSELGQPPVAVRSSATAEDLPGLSFAGQQDTFLNILGEEALLKAVRCCWASLWTARAIGYRVRNHISHQGLALAVVVQEMIQSDASGVLFTANPLTGKRSETVIDATFGLGEALVSGLVEPDHFLVDITLHRILSKTLGAKALSIRAQPGGGTFKQTEQVAGLQALPDDQILELSALGQQVAEHFGAPQDIEWAWAGGRLFLLQSRPITSLYPLPKDWHLSAPLQLLFSFGAIQGMLDPFTPLGQDIFRGLIAGLSHPFGLQLTRQTQQAFIVAGERLFVNLSGLARNPAGRRALDVIIQSIDPASSEVLIEILKDPRLAPKKGHPMGLVARLRLARVLAPFFGSVFLNLAFPAKGRQRFQRRITEAIQMTQVRCATTRTLAERVTLLQETLQSLPSELLTILVPMVVSGQASLQPLLRLSAGFPGGTQAALELTRGLPYNVTTEMDLALWDTARALRTDPSSVERLTRQDVAQSAQEYLKGTLPECAQRAISSFLQRYGMRGPGEIDFGRPRWREDPTPLLQALSSYLQIPDGALSPQTAFERGAVQAQAAQERLVAGLQHAPGGWLKAVYVRWAARRVRELVGLRESPKFSAIQVLGILRQALLENGQQLAERGVLEKAEDLFFLNFSELDALAAGEPRDWRALVHERRRIYEQEKARRQVPRLLLSDGTAFYERTALAETASGSETGEEIIHGSPVSPGVVEGIVNVVLDPRRALLAPGEILVCPATDPGWTPLFLAAGGLVMEVGGMMTHGSVVAREYGIPAVVGVAQATRRLKTGQRVQVDGSQGVVIILDRESIKSN